MFCIQVFSQFAIDWFRLPTNWPAMFCCKNQSNWFIQIIYWELAHSQINKFCWDQCMSDHNASCKLIQIFRICYNLCSEKHQHLPQKKDIESKLIEIFFQESVFNQNNGHCSRLLLTERESSSFALSSQSHRFAHVFCKNWLVVWGV